MTMSPSSSSHDGHALTKPVNILLVLREDLPWTTFPALTLNHLLTQYKQPARGADYSKLQCAKRGNIQDGKPTQPSVH